MENLDRELQAKVWQRVQNRIPPDMPPLGKENVKPLLLLLQENSQAYQQLAGRLPGAEEEKLRQLRQESRKCIRCLKGIALLAGEKVKVGHAALAPGGGQGLLQPVVAEQSLKPHVFPSSPVDYPLL